MVWDSTQNDCAWARTTAPAPVLRRRFASEPLFVGLGSPGSSRSLTPSGRDFSHNHGDFQGGPS